MADGESQLSVVIADRCEPIFPKLISGSVPPSLAVSTGHGVSFGLAIPGSSLSVRGVLIFQRTCTPDGIKLLPTRCGEETCNCPFTYRLKNGIFPPHIFWVYILFTFIFSITFGVVLAYHRNKSYLWNLFKTLDIFSELWYNILENSNILRAAAR